MNTGVRPVIHFAAYIIAITSWFSSSYIKDFNEAFHMENVSKKVLERAEFKEEDILELYPLVYGKLKEQIECPANLKR
jgi:hypothetical protein